MRTRLRSQLARPIALAAALVVLSGCGDAAGPTAPQLRRGEPQFDRTTSGEMGVGFQQVVDCEGTLVDVTGLGTFTFSLNTDNTGGQHFTGHVQMTLTGVSAVPVLTYTGSTTGKQTWNIPLPPFELTLVSKGNLKANETETNYAFHQMFHITMNANGVISATAANASCHGSGS